MTLASEKSLQTRSIVSGRSEKTKRTSIVLEKGAMLAALLVMSLSCLGCLDWNGELARKRQRLMQTQEDLKKKVQAAKPMFVEREVARQELSVLEAQIEELQASRVGKEK